MSDGPVEIKLVFLFLTLLLIAARSFVNYVSYQHTRQKSCKTKSMFLKQVVALRE
jgi:hypothetical protein